MIYEVWKFPIEPADRIGVRLPTGAVLLSIQVKADDHQVYLWAAVDPKAETELREFRLIPTGVAFEAENLRGRPHQQEVMCQGTNLTYVGTFQIIEAPHVLVFHLFEIDRRS
jgi:hypothetical protein